jgi:hypothetical protein
MGFNACTETFCLAACDLPQISFRNPAPATVAGA